MKILYFEDDYSFAKAIEKRLKSEFPDCSIVPIRYEKDMRAYLTDHPDPEVVVIILDVMVGYQQPNSIESAPGEIEEEGYLRAGVRVLGLLRQSPEYAKIPTLFYSNVPSSKIVEALKEQQLDEKSIEIISKGDNGDKLVEAIRLRVPKQ